MRCNCCDRPLGDKEISWNKEINAFEMCGECLEISLEAAYSDGFIKEDDSSILITDKNEDDYQFSFVMEPWSKGVEEDN